jgi:hypothetical protein
MPRAALALSWLTALLLAALARAGTLATAPVVLFRFKGSGRNLRASLNVLEGVGGTVLIGIEAAR